MRREKRFSFAAFALGNLRRRPFRTVSMMFLVALLSFVLLGGSLVLSSLKSGTDALSKRLGADLLVVPQGYEQRTEKILLGGEPSTFYMREAWTKRISGVPGVRAASPQLFVASLNADCCSAAVQIVGFDQQTDFTVAPWIRTALPGTLSMDEIVIGGGVSGSVGGGLKFLGRNYTVAAKMEPTGTGFDNSVFMSFPAAERAADDYVKKTGGAKVPENAVSSITVSVRDGYSAGEVRQNISRALGSEKPGISVITSESVVGSVAGSLRTSTRFAAALAAFLWALSVLILGIVFSVVLNERKREFGILRSLGATKRKLASMVLLEAGGVSLCGGVLGVAFCALLVVPLGAHVRQTMSLPYLQPSALRFAALAAASLVLSFAAGPVASLASVFRICRGDTDSVIREGSL